MSLCENGPSKPQISPLGSPELLSRLVTLGDLLRHENRTSATRMSPLFVFGWEQLPHLLQRPAIPDGDGDAAQRGGSCEQQALAQQGLAS